jgi:hypothetical protein
MVRYGNWAGRNGFDYYNMPNHQERYYQLIFSPLFHSQTSRDALIIIILSHLQPAEPFLFDVIVSRISTSRYNPETE